jgi:hypothetical protein
VPLGSVSCVTTRFGCAVGVSRPHLPWSLFLTLGLGCIPTSVAVGESPFATAVISYVPGIGAAAGYTNPNAALGSPERFTGEGFLPQAVTPFQPAFTSNELVSIGMGGSLVLSFDHDVQNDPRNPYGVDLLVFGNAFCADADAPNGVIASFFAEGGTIAVSPDGIAWTTVPLLAADGPFPTLGYRDVGPYDTRPGSLLTDFTRPVDPALAGSSLVGLDWQTLVDAYDGSGGGVGVDLTSVSLAAIRYVRITGPATFGMSPEIDAIADVSPALTLGDLDADGAVGAADLAILLGEWGSANSQADLDADGDVDAGDLALLLGSWS